MPNIDYEHIVQAQDDVLTAALDVLRASRGDVGNPNYGDEVQYCEERLALAARELTRATENLPEKDQPVGWKEGD